MCVKCRYPQSTTPQANQVAHTSQDEVFASGNAATFTRTVPTQVRTLEDLIRVCEIDTVVWEVVEFHCSKSEMVSVPRAIGKSKDWERPSTEPVITPLYHVTAKCRRKVAVITAREEIAALIADAKSRIAPRATPLRVAATGRQHMLEVLIFDLHLGKLAWRPETGYAPYDLKLAEAAFADALNALIARTASFSFDRVVFPIGNDFFHADTKAGTTTKGTPLDMDSRYHKMFTTGRRLITDAIERLRLIAPIVDVPVIPGNHDSLSAFQLGDSLDCYFHNTPGVRILNEANPRKYVEYGSNMILYTHGDTIKLDKLPLLMSTEQSAMWGRTVHREARVGHRHTLQVQEHMGVRVRTCPALCGPDSWHASQGYVGNLRSAESHVWDKDEGVVAQATYTIDERAGDEEKAA